jgi:hypothetical protein
VSTWYDIVKLQYHYNVSLIWKLQYHYNVHLTFFLALVYKQPFTSQECIHFFSFHIIEQNINDKLQRSLQFTSTSSHKILEAITVHKWRDPILWIPDDSDYERQSRWSLGYFLWFSSFILMQENIPKSTSISWIIFVKENGHKPSGIHGVYFCERKRP